jgi:predicted  nucleic acid-binding Zn-ribbon protein
MGEIETLKNEIAPLEEEMNSLSTKVTEEKGRISGELEGLQKQLEEKGATKQQIFSTLDASLVSHYERILVRRQPAVAEVRSGTCQECNMNVPPQLFIELQKYREVIHCPSCHRILFIPIK